MGIDSTIAIPTALLIVMVREYFAYLRQKKPPQLTVAPTETLDSIVRKMTEYQKESRETLERLREHLHDIKNVVARLEMRQSLIMENERTK